MGHREHVSVSIKCDQMHNQVQVESFTSQGSSINFNQETILYIFDSLWMLLVFFPQKLLYRKSTDYKNPEPVSLVHDV